MTECRKNGWIACLWLWIILSSGLSAYAYAETAISAREKQIGDSLLPETGRKDEAVQLLYDKGDYKAAYQLAEQNMSTAQSKKDWASVIYYYEILIAIDMSKNDYRSAFKRLKEKEEITHRLYADQKVQVALEMQKRYDTDSIRRQITETEEKLRATEQKIASRSRMIAGLAGLACLAIIIGIVQTYLYVRKKRLNDATREEIKENEHQLAELAELADKFSEENQRLIQENADLGKSNTVKDKLLSVISHDLRSPMSSLQALLGLFNANNIARKDLVDFFGKLLSRVENTSTMLENLLHWSQYQLKGIEPIFEKADMQKVIDDSINFYRMQAEQKHIVIDNSLKTSVKVCADVEMLKIILRNLISNALKFTHSGGIITIKALTKERFVIVSVKDTGVGISPENQAKMFAMSNFTTPGTEKEKGTGLGLMLCKDFVEHNHGKIWMDSKEGIGTTFYFSVPLAEE